MSQQIGTLSVCTVNESVCVCVSLPDHVLVSKCTSSVSVRLCPSGEKWMQTVCAHVCQTNLYQSDMDVDISVRLSILK